jgi:hypothetical protein
MSSELRSASALRSRSRGNPTAESQTRDFSSCRDLSGYRAFRLYYELDIASTSESDARGAAIAAELVDALRRGFSP